MNREALHSAIAKTAELLALHQRDDGHWEDFKLTVGLGTEWVTGYIGVMLSEAPRAGVEDERIGSMLDRAAEWVIAAEHEGGGWGFNDDSGVDADSTSSCLLFLLDQGRGEGDCVRRAIDVLVENQNADGGIGTFSQDSIQTEINRNSPNFPFWDLVMYRGWCSSDTEVSAISTLALLAAGTPPGDPVVERIVSFILDTQQPDGPWNAYWSNGKMLGTSFCMRALAAVEGNEERLRRAAEWLVSIQNDDGSWTDGVGQRSTPYGTALATRALASCREPEPAQCLARGAEWLLSTQLVDGGWESCPLMRVPKPWDRTQLQNPTMHRAVPDHNRLFTSATVVNALANAMHV